MTYYFKSGDRYSVSSTGSVDISDKLEPGNYSVKFDKQSGAYYLIKINDFKPLSKYYGPVESYSDRIIATFLDRPNTTGALFTGDKGSGKSILAKKISIQLAEQFSIPTIVINEEFYGDAFNQFIQSIDDHAAILFDEFEKTYTSEGQAHVLTLLDGVYPTKKLFIITCNDIWKIDRNMVNRPGRIFYKIDYEGISIEFAAEYCEDNLKNKSYMQSMIRMVSTYGSTLNFDMLKAVVEEVNRYDMSPVEAIKLLNVSLERTKGESWVLSISPTVGYAQLKLNTNPISNDGVEVYVYKTQADSDSGENGEEYYLEQREIVKYDPVEGICIYECDGEQFVFTRQRQEKFNIESLIF